MHDLARISIGTANVRVHNYMMSHFTCISSFLGVLSVVWINIGVIN